MLLTCCRCYKVIKYCSQEVVQLTIVDRYIKRKKKINLLMEAMMISFPSFKCHVKLK